MTIVTLATNTFNVPDGRVMNVTMIVVAIVTMTDDDDDDVKPEGQSMDGVSARVSASLADRHKKESHNDEQQPCTDNN
jgi:hypothetical protein